MYVLIRNFFNGFFFFSQQNFDGFSLQSHEFDRIHDLFLGFSLRSDRLRIVTVLTTSINRPRIKPYVTVNDISAIYDQTINTKHLQLKERKCLISHDPYIKRSRLFIASSVPMNAINIVLFSVAFFVRYKLNGTDFCCSANYFRYYPTIEYSKNRVQKKNGSPLSRMLLYHM